MLALLYNAVSSSKIEQLTGAFLLASIQVLEVEP